MTRDDLCALVKDALDTDDAVDMNSSAENLAEWDSLGHLSVLTALDEATGGKAASFTDLGEANSIAAIVGILESQNII